MTKDTTTDKEIWKNAINQLATQKPGTFTSEDIEEASQSPVEAPAIIEQIPDEPIPSDETVSKEPKKTTVPDAFTTQRRKDFSKLGNYHAPTAYDKESLEETKAFIKQVYDEYEGESLEELAGLLEEAGIHIHKIFYQNNQDTPAIRAFYHPPVIVILPDRELPDKEILFDTFYTDLVLPKEEPVEEEVIEETDEKKPWWKRIFGKN